jgi:hypothetical protein
LIVSFIFTIMIYQPVLADDRSQMSDNIVLVLEAENTSNQTRKVAIKHKLPKEILPEYIEKPEGFSIEYDSEDNTFYLLADIAFNPYEVKTFYISIKNMWFIPEQDISRYMASARNLYERIMEGNNETIKDEAREILSLIRQEASKITQAQSEDQAVSEHILSFRRNQKRLDDIKNNIKRLQELDPEVKRKEGGFRLRNQNKDAVEMIMLIMIVFILLFTIISCHLWITRFRKDKKIPISKK